MPELPDITVYIERLDAKIRGDTLQRVRVLNPFLLRTAVPPIGQAEGRRVIGLERLGKRIVLALEGGLFLVLHLMIAGRLRCLPAPSRPARSRWPPSSSAAARWCSPRRAASGGHRCTCCRIAPRSRRWTRAASMS